MAGWNLDWGQTASYHNTVTLPQNGTVDFIIGRGPHNDMWGSGLRINATLTLIPAPSPSAVQFSSSSYSVGESVGTAHLTLRRTGDPSQAATVNLSIADGGSGAVPANAGSDYLVPTVLSVTWNSGETGDKDFPVTILDNTTSENTEAFTVTINNASGAFVGSPSAAAVTITDNDAASSVYRLADNLSSGGE